MTTMQRGYQFSIVQRNSPDASGLILAPAERQDLKSLQHVEGEQYQLQVIDGNGIEGAHGRDADGRFDENDIYYLQRGNNEPIRRLSGRDGLQVLNYFTNPELLQEKHWATVVSQQSENVSPWTNIPSETPLAQLLTAGVFNEDQIEEIQQKASAWFMDGHLEANLLTGARVFSLAESHAWTSSPSLAESLTSFNNLQRWFTGDGGYHHASLRFLGGQVMEKVSVAWIFNGLASAVGGVSLIWHLFVWNYACNDAGHISNNSRDVDTIQDPSINERRNPRSRSDQQRLDSNVAIVKARLSVDHRNLYFGLTRPVIALALLGDPDSRHWMFNEISRHSLKEIIKHPWDLGARSMLTFYGVMFQEAATAIVGGGIGLGLLVAASSTVGIFGLTQTWYHRYAHLEYGSTGNHVASAASTVFSEAWLISRAGRQIKDITESSLLTCGNLSSFFSKIQGRQLNFQIVDTIRDFFRDFFPTGKLFAKRFVNPSYSALTRMLPEMETELTHLRSLQSGSIPRGFFGYLNSFFNQSRYEARLALKIAELERNLGRYRAVEQSLIQSGAANALRLGAVTALGVAAVGGIAMLAALASGRYAGERTLRDDVRMFLPGLL